MEFFHLLKASQKSGKKDAVIWFTAKSAARAALTLDVALEDADIETGRGKDYAKPVRTDMPIVDDLPEEGVVCFEFCKRYQLADDQRTWNVIPDAASQSETTTVPDSTTSDENQPVAAVTATDTAEVGSTSQLENRTPAVRFAVHLLGDKYLSEISQEQHIVANELASDEGNVYFQCLLKAKNDVADISDLSLHAEWKLVQAIKDVFPQDKEHDPALLAVFMSSWIKAEAGDRNQLAEDWKSGKLPARDEPDYWYENGLRVHKTGDEFTRYPVCKLPFRQQLLAQLTVDELRHHVTRGEHAELYALEMDTDNSYVQTLLLAAESCSEIKAFDTKDLWRYTNAIRKVFSMDKRHELALLLQFTKAWVATPYIDRGILTREWAAGNRISHVQRTDAGTNADGGYVTDRGADAHHTLDTLDLEIACALLPMDFHHFEIPSSILRRAKEIVANKEEPWKSWSKILRNQPGVLAVNRAAIFNLVRIAPENIHLTPVAHLEFVNQTMTAEFNAKTELVALQAVTDKPAENAIDSHFVDQQLAAERGEFVDGVSDPDDPKWVKEDLTAASQPQVANLGGGVFSIEGLMGTNNDPVINTPTNSFEKTETVTENSSDVQMEEAQPEKVEVTDAVSPGKSTDAADPQTDALNPAEVLAAAVPELPNATQPEVTTEAPEETASAPEYPAYFEPGRYEGLPNNVYHAANGISSTQVKDARVSLMYFNARHVAKTIPREGSKVLDMGNLVHALALQPENLDEEFSVEPVIPEGAFTTAATLRAFIDEYNASLPALLSADDIKALLEEHNATLPAPVPTGGSLEETAQSYMTLPAEFQRIEADQKQTAAAMKACIKEYNATLPAPVKTSGSRDALLEQLAIINPDLVAQEAQKPAPLKVSGTKAEMIQAVKSVMPDAVFADELLDAWRENPGDKILVTQQQMQTALAIQKALHEHPTAGKLLLHPDRSVETSYFGIDEETGLEIRVRPDLEIDIDAVRIGADLKTISMWNVKQSGLRARLHREIIDRDYHLSAAMYMQTAALDQFFWIFVNKDEGYHWIAIVEASEELIELGMLEYRQTMNRIANAFDTGVWPAPITEDYTDELNDFDLRRLEALRTQA
ncbi:RecE family exodeoxyribonuclease [Leclercia adecarboxylata]|uniref:RecE family exodeoxyribonuclease n=1 Tax=Leclercia adecarboxylata TaxID=83655 RepID=A0ABU6I2X6_9ENTR|nr:RecE family exodeoxyribonuclease [Leclercia adecarboxylata]MEC3900717.1 RecE family exodeoxyribonuclease [Leclercia adecarboxylata]MEC3935935.1 RecE family exodeoxyribonuclease [Leclercia adecarboxylata]